MAHLIPFHLTYKRLYCGTEHDPVEDQNDDKEVLYPLHVVFHGKVTRRCMRGGSVAYETLVPV